MLGPWTARLCMLVKSDIFNWLPFIPDHAHRIHALYVSSFDYRNSGAHDNGA